LRVPLADLTIFTLQETLRLYPITPLPEKFATQDTILPLSQDIQTTSGEKISGIPIRKGQLVMLGLASYQRLVFFRTETKFVLRHILD
jgi:cytochrome P450